jgi:hypothetical protein
LTSNHSPISMAPRRKGEIRARHGTRKLILKVFGGPGAPSTLTTSAIVERVSKEAGSKIPEFSVYSALRTLVKRKVLKAKRVGNQKSYTFVDSKATARVPGIPPSATKGRTRPVLENPPPLIPGSPFTQSPGMPHKLAVGEALVLNVGEEHVETMTNVHGKLVIERHSRRKPKG